MVDFVNAAKSDAWIRSRKGTFISEDLHAQVHNYANRSAAPRDADVRIVAARQSSVPSSHSAEADRVHRDPFRDMVLWPKYAGELPWPWLAAGITAAIGAPWFMPGEGLGPYLLAGYAAGGVTFYVTGDSAEKAGKKPGTPVDDFILRRKKTISEVPEQKRQETQFVPSLRDQVGSLSSA